MEQNKIQDIKDLILQTGDKNEVYTSQLSSNDIKLFLQNGF